MSRCVTPISRAFSDRGLFAHSVYLANAVSRPPLAWRAVPVASRLVRTSLPLVSRLIMSTAPHRPLPFFISSPAWKLSVVPLARFGVHQASLAPPFVLISNLFLTRHRATPTDSFSPSKFRAGAVQVPHLLPLPEIRVPVSWSLRYPSIVAVDITSSIKVIVLLLPFRVSFYTAQLSTAYPQSWARHES
jgi:hypothetical protein